VSTTTGTFELERAVARDSARKYLWAVRSPQRKQVVLIDNYRKMTKKRKTKCTNACNFKLKSDDPGERKRTRPNERKNKNDRYQQLHRRRLESIKT
jgi:hypothetical protein